MIVSRPTTSVFYKLFLLISLLIFSPALTIAQEATSQPVLKERSQLSIAIENEINARLQSATSKSLAKRLTGIKAHYSETGFEPIWTKDGKPNEKAKWVSQSLTRAEEHGLHSADYDAEILAEKLKANPINNPAELEVHLSTVLVSYAQHLNSGRLDPTQVTRENVIYPDKISSQQILDNVRKTTNIVPFIRLLAPYTPRYDRLRKAMEAYRELAANGGWPQIPDGEVLKPAMEDPRVAILRARLTMSGHYLSSETPINANLYQGAIVDAVKLFQERHGLEIDGVIGPQTLKEINTPIETRIAMMEYNLERRRWMQNDYGETHIFANLADQVVKLVRGGKTVYAEIIQVGLPYHKTPVFTDSMEYIEFNPYWNVPYSIATKELLPKLQQNPHHYTSQGYEVLNGGNVINASLVPWNSYSRANFPVRIRQKPGDDNALGRVKFMFPNKHNIYIHDTPSKSKFNNASRFFSHGCLRLKDPFRFAEALLGPEGWSRAKIDSVVNSRKRTIVKLQSQIPVHIVYLTAWVNKDGSIHFRRDVYGRDKIMAQALAKVRGR